jgi:hypothetical protein
MTSRRFDDGGCAAMMPARRQAFCASLTSFRHFVITPRSGEVMAPAVKGQRLEHETGSA